MRSPGMLILPLALAASPLAAQGFEGVLSVKIMGDQSMDMEWNIKGSKSAATFDLWSPNGNIPVRYFVDNSAKTNTMQMALAGFGGQNNQGIQIVRDLKNAPDADKATAAVPKKLGTSQTIQGIPCNDYDLGDAAHTRACISESLGAFAYPTSPMAGGGSGPTVMAGGAMPEALMRAIEEGAQTFEMAGGGRAVIIGGGAMGGGGGDVTMISPRVVMGGGGGTVAMAGTQDVTATAGAAGGGGGATFATRTMMTTSDSGGTPTSVTKVSARDASGKMTDVTMVNGEITQINGEAATEASIAALKESGIRLPSGRPGLPPMGPPTPMSNMPAWATAIGTTGFPLKVWTREGKSLLEVTMAARTPVPDDTFAIPSGYMNLGGSAAPAAARRTGGGN